MDVWPSASHTESSDYPIRNYYRFLCLRSIHMAIMRFLQTSNFKKQIAREGYHASSSEKLK